MADKWKITYNLFNPTEKLAGERLAFFVERDGSRTKETAQMLRFSDENEKILFVGQMGSGKSSELRFLANLLREDFFNVIIDVEEMTDIFTVNHVELLYMMGVSVYAAATSQGYKIDKKWLQDLGDSLETLVREQTENKSFKLDLNTILATLGTAVGVATGGTAGVAFVAASALFKDMKLGLGVDSKALRKLEVKPQVSKISQALNQLLQAVEAATSRKTFMVIDGLDRIEFSQARLIFAESQILTMPQCLLAYVVPSHLFHSTHMSLARQHFKRDIQIPNIKLQTRDPREIHEAGYAQMRQVAEKRLHTVNLELSDVFTEEALNLLIEKSGGLMREFVRFVQDAVITASVAKVEHIALEHAQTVVDEQRRKYMAALSTSRLQELAQLQRTQMISGSEISNELLQNQYILTQSNRDIWYEVHPLIADYVEAYAAQADHE